MLKVDTKIYFLIVILFGVVLCQMPKKPPIIPLVKDIPFIQCDACQKAAKALFKSVKAKREEIKPVKLGEDAILSIIEGACDTDSENGKWIRYLDIVEEDGSLKLKEHSNMGKCKEECKTIARSCEQTIGDVDTDLSEILWQNELKLSHFLNKVCHEMTSVCKKKPKYKAGSRKDFKFIEMAEKDIQAEAMMKNMKGMPGMPGLEMYDPDDLKNMREQMGIDDKMIKDYTKQQQGESKEEKNVGGGDEKKSQESGDSGQHQTQLNFFDTVKAVGRDIIGKIKKLFGIGNKSEL